MLSTRLFFGQVNSIYPRTQKIKTISVDNDFACVSRMFYMTGNDLREGIEYAKKSNDKRLVFLKIFH